MKIHLHVLSVSKPSLSNAAECASIDNWTPKFLFLLVVLFIDDGKDPQDYSRHGFTCL